MGLDGPSLLLTASPLIVPSTVHEAVAIAPKPCGFSNSLERANPPMEGDELPQELQKPHRKVANAKDSASKRGQKKQAAVK
jgi:hypothetical protein